MELLKTHWELLVACSAMMMFVWACFQWFGYRIRGRQNRWSKVSAEQVDMWLIDLGGVALLIMSMATMGTWLQWACLLVGFVLVGLGRPGSSWQQKRSGGLKYGRLGVIIGGGGGFAGGLLTGAAYGDPGIGKIIGAIMLGMILGLFCAIFCGASAAILGLMSSNGTENKDGQA